ncbi:hypothetical protein [Donghicola eburneus]|uniref:TnsA endonuclease N-terminal domain-containing protein n=1 Tax=Donghicola eburneus TaxID=393278 RepID=A0A1M4N416_9RHOB|nr:hypothetical protein [Donghicola eburneus]SCM68734.1 hypothetical protein KARMA_2961 [Donghicola eburneus]
MFDDHGGVLLPAPSRADRTIQKASAAHCTGYTVLGDGEGTRFQGESYLELCHLYLLNAMKNVAEMREQVRFLYGWDPEKPQAHYFDVFATLDDGTRIAFAVKPEVRLASGRVEREMSEIAWWVQEFDFADDVRILTEADINPVDLRNAKALAAVRQPDPEADAAARAVLEALPAGAGQSLRDLTLATGMKARGYRALLRLLRSGTARLQRHELIRPTTIIVNAALPTVIAPSTDARTLVSHQHRRSEQNAA